jgi:hypothetical protein
LGFIPEAPNERSEDHFQRAKSRARLPAGRVIGWHVVAEVGEPCCTISKIMAQDLDEAGEVSLTEIIDLTQLPVTLTAFITLSQGRAPN